MSSYWLEVAGLFNRNWRFSDRADRAAVTWWPTSLPGSDLDEQPRRRARRPARPRIRRGRIQLVGG
jgi:hypothetical protein